MDVRSLRGRMRCKTNRMGEWVVAVGVQSCMRLAAMERQGQMGWVGRGKQS
jgi:hypothetical protein